MVICLFPVAIVQTWQMVTMFSCADKIDASQFVYLPETKKKPYPAPDLSNKGCP
jgi:hypothetical protein